MVSENPIELVCCVCGKKLVSSNIFDSGWSLHEANDKRTDLCFKCHQIQDARDEQESQIRGNPPKPLPKAEPTEAVVKAQSVPICNQLSSGVTIRARFKLESIDVKVGETLIAGDLTEAQEIRLPMSGDQLRVGGSYFINLK